MNADALASTDAWSLETDSLVEGALLAVREAARLDDDPILPPLPAPTPRRDVVVLSRVDLPLPSPSEIVRASASVALPAKAVAAPSASRRRGMPWPVLACGLIASLAAGAAFMASPVGHLPRVQKAIHSVVAKVRL